METKLERIAELAERDPQCRFTSLAHLLNEENLKGCYWELKRDAAAGVDGRTWEEYGEELNENISDLVSRLKAKKYWPRPVRRTYIPKEGKPEMRPIGIPALEDKIVQRAIARILTAIYEADFLDISYGFRPGRSPHDALDAVDKTIMARPINWVLDADIEGFFDNVDHEWMMRCLEQRIKDRTLLKLIRRFLEAGIIEEGEYYETDRGMPQGGNLSPVLSNIYLHYVLDLWVERKLKRELSGYVELIRFADDYILCFQRKAEAEAGERALKQRLAKFGLELAEEKTRLIAFGRYARENAERRGKKPETFDFLGFTHYCDQTRKGKFKVGRKTAAKKFHSKFRTLSRWVKAASRMMRPAEWWPLLRAKLIGHYRYYGVSGNYPMLARYYRLTIRLVYKWLNRRSQKASYNWEEFRRYLERHPLPKPKIYHNLYTLCRDW